MNEEHQHEKVSGSGGTPLACAVISTDSAFRERMKEVLVEEPEVELRLVLEDSFTRIMDPQLKALREVAPDLVFVDLSSDPQVGLRFVQFLVDSSLAKAVVGAGSASSPELLLQAMEVGMLEFLPTPLDPHRVRAVVGRVRRRSSGRTEVERRRSPGRILSVFSPKGGAGATTLAVNLAVEIHRISRKRTLLLDLDLELGETALLLGMEPRFSTVDLVLNDHRMDEGLLASYIERDDSGLEVLAAPYEPGDVGVLEVERLAPILSFLRDRYDYVVLDLPTSLNPVTLRAAEVSDRVLMVATPDLQSVRNVNRSLNRIRELGAGRGEDWVQLVVNRDGPQASLPGPEVERTLGMKAAATLADEPRRLQGALHDGRPLALQTRSRYGDDVRGLASRITGVELAPKSRLPFVNALFGKRSGKSSQGTERTNGSPDTGRGS